MEKNADILIADHAKTNAPPNSFSWKWIDASLKAGVLLDLAEYPAGPQISVDSSRGVEDVVQTGFVGGVGKATRTKFTAEDDKVLAAWVTQKILEGHTDRGNGIYNDLAAKVGRVMMDDVVQATDSLGRILDILRSLGGIGGSSMFQRYHLRLCRLLLCLRLKRLSTLQDLLLGLHHPPRLDLLPCLYRR